MIPVSELYRRFCAGWSATSKAAEQRLCTAAVVSRLAGIGDVFGELVAGHDASELLSG